MTIYGVRDIDDDRIVSVFPTVAEAKLEVLGFFIEKLRKVMYKIPGGEFSNYEERIKFLKETTLNDLDFIMRPDCTLEILNSISNCGYFEDYYEILPIELNGYHLVKDDE